MSEAGKRQVFREGERGVRHSAGEREREREREGGREEGR